MCHDQTSPSLPEPALLSRTEFSKAVAASQRRMTWALVMLVAGLLLLLPIIAVVAAAMNDAGVPEHSPWRALPFAAVIPAMFAAMSVITHYIQKRFLKCPHCSDPLDKGNTPFFATVTGRCPNCAAPLFEDDHGSNIESHDSLCAPLLTRSDLENADIEAQNEVRRPAYVWGVAAAFLIVAGVVLAPWLPDVLAPRLGATWTPFVKPLLLSPGVIIGGWAMIVRWRFLRVSRPCPHCGAAITPYDCASVIGNCPTCGRPAVSDPFPGMQPIPDRQPKQQWTTAEFYNLAKRNYGRLWIGCFVGAGLAVIWVTSMRGMLPSHATCHISLYEITMFFICFGGMLFTQCAGVLLWHCHSARHLRCSECGKELLDHYGLVVSSRRCYHCGSTVIKPPHDPPPQ